MSNSLAINLISMCDINWNSSVWVLWEFLLLVTTGETISHHSDTPYSSGKMKNPKIPSPFKVYIQWPLQAKSRHLPYICHRPFCTYIHVDKIHIMFHFLFSINIY